MPTADAILPKPQDEQEQDPPAAEEERSRVTVKAMREKLKARLERIDHQVAATQRTIDTAKAEIENLAALKLELATLLEDIS